MFNQISEPIGAAWLVKHYQVVLFSKPPVISQIDSRRATRIEGGFFLESYPETMRPTDEPAAHLQFHLRHEMPHFEFLSRLFASSGAVFIQEWVNREPTGQYARRAAFLYEWFTEEELDVPERLAGNYVDAIDNNKLMAASAEYTTKCKRWRINDNLPGNRYFCPLVTKTEALSQAVELNIPELLAELTTEFGEDLLMRAAVWLTLRESKASFAIEGEIDQMSRIQRFADVIARHTGQGGLALNNEVLANIQQEILGQRTTLSHFGIRQSPVFIGELIRYEEVVHYVAPPAIDVKKMLDGLNVFLEKTQGQSAIIRAAVVAFGFVYIHPLADGNGRVHRFLINDILRRDGVIEYPVILPVSAVISDDPSERRAYDQVLDSISKPLMQQVQEYLHFHSTLTTYPDGVVSNINFQGDEQARPTWRYPHFNPHILFLSQLLYRTLTGQMRQESRYLRNHIQARNAIKEIIEMPDYQADRLLRSIEQNQGKLSNVLAKEIPVLREPGIWEEIVEAVKEAFQ